jgi:hypothetical protein
MFHRFGSGVPSSSARLTHLGRQACVTRKDPPSWGRACTSLHWKVCVGALDCPPGAAYYSQTTGGSAEAPGDFFHFRELIAIFFH